MKSRPVWKFIVNLWNLLDMAIIGLIVYRVFLYLDHLGIIHPALDEMRRMSYVYYESYWVARREQLEDLVVGVIVLASWIKVPRRCCILAL